MALTPERCEYYGAQSPPRPIDHRKPLGSKPLAVLTHSPDCKMVPDLPDDLMGDRAHRRTCKRKRPSSRPTTPTPKKAGHAIHIDDPDLVLKAIREVVANVKKPK